MMVCSQIKKILEYFSVNKRINSLRKTFLSLLEENLTLIKNIFQNKTNFLSNKKFLSNKTFFQENCYYSEIVLLNQDKSLLQRGQEIFSQRNILSQCSERLFQII